MARRKRNTNRLPEGTPGPVLHTGIAPDRVDSIRLTATGQEVPVSASWVHSDYPDIVFADLGPDPILPDSVDTVPEVRLKDG